MKTEDERGSAEVLQAFADLPDSRSRSCAYPLDELLLVALSAITSSAEDWVNVSCAPRAAPAGLATAPRLRRLFLA